MQSTLNHDQPHRVAFVIVDVQNDFIGNGSLSVTHGERVSSQWNSTLAFIPVYFVSQYYYDPPMHSYLIPPPLLLSTLSFCRLL